MITSNAGKVAVAGSEILLACGVVYATVVDAEGALCVAELRRALGAIDLG